MEREHTVGRVRAHTVAAEGGETVIDEWKRFRTLDPTAGQTRFVMWNDTHVFDETIRALHQVTPGADFLVWNGETCNGWTREDLLVPTLLNPGGCDISMNRPLLVAYGNHDAAHRGVPLRAADRRRSATRASDLGGWDRGRGST